MNKPIGKDLGEKIIRAGFCELLTYIILQSKQLYGVNRKYTTDSIRIYFKSFSTIVAELCLILDSSDMEMYNISEIGFRINLHTDKDGFCDFSGYDDPMEINLEELIELKFKYYDNQSINFRQFVDIHKDYFYKLWNKNDYDKLLLYMREPSEQYSVVDAIAYLSYMTNIVCIALQEVRRVIDDEIKINSINEDEPAHNRMARLVQYTTSWNMIANYRCQLGIMDDRNINKYVPLRIESQAMITPEGEIFVHNCTLIKDNE